MDNYKKVSQILWCVFAINTAIALTKIILGGLTSTGSVLSDGLHSLSDGFTNLVGLLGLKLSRKPKDNLHQYGHNKLEAVFGLIVGAILASVAVGLFKENGFSFFENRVVMVSPISIAVMIGTLLINLGVTSYETVMGKKLNSTILSSDAKHTKADIFTSIGVLIGLLAMYLGASSKVDSIVGFIVAGFILYAAYEVFRENVSLLLDKAVLNEEEIRLLVDEFDEIKGVHKMRSRGIGSKIFLDMHIFVPSELSIKESHALEHRLKEKIKLKYGNESELMLHIEPVEDKLCCV